VKKNIHIVLTNFTKALDWWRHKYDVTNNPQQVQMTSS